MEAPPPHVVILPFPAQGHVKPMLNLAMLLSNAFMHVTFTTSDAVLHSLLRQIDLPSFIKTFPLLDSKPLPDGHPTQPDSAALLGQFIVESIGVTSKVTLRLFRELLASLSEEEGPPTCAIVDGLAPSAIGVADELGIPVVVFRTQSATCTWVNFNLQHLIDQGVIPFHQGEMDCPITCIPGLANLIRRRDLPSMCRQKSDAERAMLQFYLDQTSAMRRASALILSTFAELEPGPIANLGGSIFPDRVYAIGPLQALSRRIIPDLGSALSEGALRTRDRSCMAWLDSQQPNSVLYVSFGSFLTLTCGQKLELWHGVVNSGKPFVWVAREGSILVAEPHEDESESEKVPAELVAGTRERGLVVEWVPQEEVLAHPAVGGFLTHCGWNSTLEEVWKRSGSTLRTRVIGRRRRTR